MPNKNAKTCWEYWECKLDVREKCPAFKSDKPCWHVASQYCGRVAKRGIEKCFVCEWFKLSHPTKQKGILSTSPFTTTKQEKGGQLDQKL